MAEFGSLRANDLFHRSNKTNTAEIELDTVAQQSDYYTEKPKTPLHANTTAVQTWISAFITISFLILSCILVAALVVSVKSSEL